MPPQPLDPPPPKWEPVRSRTVVFRYVQHDHRNHPEFAMNFLADRDNPDKKRVDPLEHPDFRLGMSVFATEDQARENWAEVFKKLSASGSDRNKRRKREPRLKMGHFIAEVELVPGQGFELAGPADKRGHLTLKGDPEHLAGATKCVYPAARSDP
jgi:hypothetical protein